MKLTAWLSQVTGLDVLPAGELHELRWWDIKYLDETDHLMGGGVLVKIPVLSAKGVYDLARRDRWEIDPLGDGRWVVAYQLGEALVRLLIPLVVVSTARPLLRYDESLARLREHGF